MSPWLDAVIFLFTLALLFFAPGLIVLEALFGRGAGFSSWERLLFSFGLSVGILDFLMIGLGKAGLAIHQKNILIGLALVGAASLLAGWLLKKKAPLRQERESALSFPKKHARLFLLL